MAQPLRALNCGLRYSESVSNQPNNHLTTRITAVATACTAPAIRTRSDAPVIMDTSGAFYGRLTINRGYAQLVTSPSGQAWIVGGVCGG